MEMMTPVRSTAPVLAPESHTNVCATPAALDVSGPVPSDGGPASSVHGLKLEPPSVEYSTTIVIVSLSASISV
jgi:hypothetical protein